MKAPFHRAARVPADVLSHAALGRGDRVLAHTMAADGTWLLGTLDALVVVPVPLVEAVGSIPWQQVETADWDREQERLTVTEVGEFGQTRPVHEFSIADPGRLLQLVRERVTASVLLQRRVEVSGRRGLTVLARRSPRRDGEVTWAVEYDDGVDVDDPAVAAAAAAGLRAAREEVGLA